MNRQIPIAVLAFALLLSQSLPLAAEVATQQEALNVATNWITAVIRTTGGWGGLPTARVSGIQQFDRGSKRLGYYCSVDPQGFVVVSRHKELAAVKAYSETCSLDLTKDDGMTDVIKSGLERMVSGVEKRLGNIETAKGPDIAKLLDINYRSLWDTLASDPKDFASAPPATLLENYQESGTLLTSSWHQRWPYNDQCPIMGCTDPTLNLRPHVGCVATAGAQLMRYWNWPPYGQGAGYDDDNDWVNMLDRVDGNSSLTEIAAAAELCHEIGVAVGMIYGCDGSEAWTYDMVGVYEEHYRYSSNCTVRFRPDYSASDWFTRIKNDINVNRPIQYRILAHSIVCDGWKEVGDPATKWYHMNYGWDSGRNAWYVLDALYQVGGGTTDDEYILEHTYPAAALGATVAGAYPVPTYPYRYVDQDAECAAGATFASGQSLQFLPNVTLTCTSAADPMRIDGTTALNTRLFSRGDQARGLLIESTAAIKVSNGGTIVMR